MVPVHLPCSWIVKVPDVLITGNHKEIENWRKKEMLKRTKKRRGDLLGNDFKNQSEYKNLDKG